LLLSLLLVSIASIAFTSAGLLSKEEKMKCFGEASERVKTEPDADLKDKITSTLAAIKSVSENVKSLTPAQKDRIVSHYFTGTCEPLKNFFQ
ncbi:hypothetical protein PFISCL1PPCAC_29174, partial [Pristionchus fissidentatus]